MKGIASAAIAAILFTSQLATAEDGNFYIGGKLGFYDIELGGGDISETAAGAYVGYRFNEHVSIEGEYVHLTEDDLVGLDVDGDLWALSVRPSYPINENWEVFGKLGWGWLDVEADVANFGTITEDDDDFFWGVGTQWSGKTFHFRGEVQADSDFPDFLIYTIGVGIDF